MRADDRAEAVVRRLDRAHPIAEGLVGGVAQGARAAADRPHFGAEQFHAEDVGPLPADVFLAHVDHAFQPERAQAVAVATPCCPAPVSAITRALAHAPGQERLAERVVDLVGAGVVEVFAFQVDLGPAALSGSAAGRGTAATAGPRNAGTDRPTPRETTCRPRPSRTRRSTRPRRGSGFRAHSGRRTVQNGRRRRERGCWLACGIARKRME